jgi:hypothetical protein
VGSSATQMGAVTLRRTSSKVGSLAWLPENCTKRITFQGKFRTAGSRLREIRGLSTLPELGLHQTALRRPETRLMTRMINATTSRR